VNAFEIIAVEDLPLIKKGDNIAELVCKAAEKQNTSIQEGDVIVVTHVVVSKAEGNVVNLDEILPSERARKIAQQTQKEPELVEVVLRETKEIVRIGPNSIITETKNGIVCANAGVDRSNVEGERNVVLLPKNPNASAEKIRQEIKSQTGFKPIRDRRGEEDLFGYVLKIKQTAVADELASAAELVIGQANEGIPVAIVRGYKYQAAENTSATELTRPREKDLFR
jgi:coenzyme F420-0:L-glutamate ligase/coenzyme F420-1:gamma-L-glutamate ligase